MLLNTDYKDVISHLQYKKLIYTDPVGYYFISTMCTANCFTAKKWKEMADRHRELAEKGENVIVPYDNRKTGCEIKASWNEVAV